MDIDKFIAVRPRLYHLTARSNLPLIQRTGCLQTAAHFLEQTGTNLLRMRRKESQVVVVEGDRIHLRDQAPLHAGNVKFDEGWTFEMLVEHLNRHVFFWPGTEAGPIEHGRRHFARYAREDNVILRLETACLFRANPQLSPRFSAYNSGSPRCSGGKRSPRGLGTFSEAGDFVRTPGAVVEVVFPGRVTLPSSELAILEPRDLIG